MNINAGYILDMTEQSNSTDPADRAGAPLFDRLTAGQEGEGGLSDSARTAEPRNFDRHILALAGSKVADGLVDPKLVLSWLLTHLGAGSFWTGLLVPVREAGALLPQLFTAGRIHAMPRRKWAWAAGSVGQGAAAAGIVISALTLTGPEAGAAVVALLALLALCRSVCSVSYKDVLGKTVGKTRRGTATGTAASVASGAVIVFALALMTGWVDRFSLVIGALLLAVLGWMIAALMMSRVEEEPQAGESEGVAASLAKLSLLRDRPQLARFVAARSALVGTALAPPYLVMLASDQSAARQLGALVLASSVASFLSSTIWGRLADQSSRLVLIGAGLAGAGALGLALLVEQAGLSRTIWAIPLVLFGLMIAYHGVRQARSTYLVDMAPADERAAYTAVSNTAVGLFLLAAGAGAAGLAAISVPLALGVFIVMCLAGIWLAAGLDEVEND